MPAVLHIKNIALRYSVFRFVWLFCLSTAVLYCYANELKRRPVISADKEGVQMAATGFTHLSGKRSFNPNPQLTITLNRCRFLLMQYQKTGDSGFLQIALQDCLNVLGEEKYAHTITQREPLVRRFYETAIQISYTVQDAAAMFYYMEQYRLDELKRVWPAAKQYATINLQQVQEQLKDGLQYFSYFETGDGIYGLLLSANNVSYQKIHFPGYRDSLQAFRKICSDGQLLNSNYNRYAALAHLLYKNIWLPFDIAPGKILINVGDEFMPVEAFTTDAKGEDFLLYRYTVSYTYAASWYFNSHPQPQSKQKRLAGMAPEDCAADVTLARLFGSVQSLYKINGFIPEVKIFEERAASKKNLLQHLFEYDIIHVYAHAGMAGGKPVLYMNDTLLCTDDIRLQQHTRTSLMFLAACETAMVQGEKNVSNSIAGSFMAAGVPAVAATLWQVESKVMYAISEHFYTLLQQGLSKDEALQQAKINFIKKHLHTAELPYYWAALVLIGNPDPVFPADDTTGSLYFAAVFNLSLCVASWAFGRTQIM